MSTCPHCHQPVAREILRCPHCQTILKAYGHPGIPLHQAQGESFLCQSCIYHEDDTCTFPQRPYAKTCTLYQDKSQPTFTENQLTYSSNYGYKAWFSKNRGWLLLVSLIAISFLITLCS